MTAIRFAAAALISVLMAGCAVDLPDSKAAITGSLKPRSQAATKSPAETRRAFCAQRHIDYQTGKIKSPEQKQADDRLCEALDRQG